MKMRFYLMCAETQKIKKTARKYRGTEEDKF